MLVVYLSICWFIGIFLASRIFWESAYWVGLATAVFLCGLILRRWSQVAWLLFGLSMLCLGGARYALAVPVIDEGHVAFYNDSGATVGLLGNVVKEPDVRDTYVNLTVAVERVAFSDGSSQLVTGNILVQAPRFPVIGYGTEVAVNGRLETPPEDDDFSYKNYLARKGVHSLMIRAQVDELAENRGNPIYQAIYALKGRAKETINQLIPNPEAALLTGILLGDDNGIPPDLAEDFRVTGMTHIIAISGQIQNQNYPILFPGHEVHHLHHTRQSYL